MADKVSRTTDMKTTDENVIREVKKLLADGKSTEEILNYIRFKHSEESVVNSIMEYLTKYRKKINKIATIFLNAFERKFKNTFYSMTLSRFMSKVLKYKEKYHLNPEEFHEVLRLFEERIYNTERINKKNSNIYPNTNLSRALGYPIIENNSAIMVSNDDDYSYLQDILKLYSMYRGKHSNILIQTMLYQPLSEEARICEYDPRKNDKYVHVHPILAALFLPKILAIEERMLYANIAGIVSAKHNRERIMTKPDYELFYSLTVDPTDVVCDAVSPIKDLKSRVEAQIQLWDSVYNLRAGRHYDSQSINFLLYIDKCRLSNNDNPDMLYTGDEGVILKRLFAIFAFRPLVVQIVPIYQPPFMVNVNPLNVMVQAPATITTLPYITYKLPLVKPDEDKEYDLEQANKQIQYYFEGDTWMPRMTRILDFSRGPIVYHIPRKIIKLPNHMAYPNLFPFTYGELNSSTMNYNNYNKIKINIPNHVDISNDNDGKKRFLICSTVQYRTTNNNMINGHVTYLFNFTKYSIEDFVVHRYDPTIVNNTNTTTINSSAEIKAEEEKNRSALATIVVYSKPADHDESDKKDKSGEDKPGKLASDAHGFGEEEGPKGEGGPKGGPKEGGPEGGPGGDPVPGGDG